MRIDLRYGPQQLREPDHSGSQTGCSTTNCTGRASLGQDQAQLSGAHVQVQALAAQVCQLPEIRAEKVQALRQAVHSGNYRSDPEKTAVALVSHMTRDPEA